MSLREKAIIKTISEDAEIRHFYLTSTGETCAIGGLARVAGVDDNTLIAAAGLRIEYKSKVRKYPRSGARVKPDKSAAAVGRIRLAISRRFGLTTNDMVRIQHQNDNNGDVMVRRQSIITVVETIARERKTKRDEYVTSDGKRFETEQQARAHAGDVYYDTGTVIAVERKTKKGRA